MGVRQRHCDAPISATTADYVGTSDDVELNATCEDREEIINVPKLASHRRAPLAMSVREGLASPTFHSAGFLEPA
jgi:hypothetical protein